MGSHGSVGSRHVTVDVIARYDEDHLPGVFTVSGSPAGRISISPADQKLSVAVQALHDSPEPDLRNLANVDYCVDHRDGATWQRLDLSYRDNLTEVYAVACAVIDRVQIEGEAFTSAVQAALAGLGDILTGAGALSRDEQVGLYGELTALLSLVRTLGADVALAGWRGPQREEHDFGLADCDVEVKTTTAEQRIHWISGAAQLSPKPGKPLLLLSIQITAAGAGPGASLNELVNEARLLVGVQSPRLEQGLRAVGFRDRHASLYADRWTLRSIPLYYAVDEWFPALTPARLDVATPSPSRIVDLRYRIKLDGMPPAAGPFSVEQVIGANS